MHLDIKPDNILVDCSFNQVKICDFGSAMSTSDLKQFKSSQGYIVARYYRAPEAILDYEQKDTGTRV